MAFSFSHALRSVWHTMTSYDRHATIDSPYRTGRHTPLVSNRNSVLTSVATASESHTHIASPYLDENGQSLSRENSHSQFNGAGSVSPYTPSSPAPYSPGMRSQSARRESQADGFEMQGSGDVPMQSFQDGLPPPPPVSHSWRKIDAWAEENYPELYDQLCEGATRNDLNELEHQLDCTLPQDVRESLMVHDGQERWGTPTGIIFGSMLLDCEELVQEWETWRKVNQQFLLDTAGPRPAAPTSQASSSTAPPARAGPNNPAWRQDLLGRQDSVPPGAIQKAYAHPGWIPLVRDWGGNNLAVDVAPGPNGKWGQIILFGRDYDTKYVVARSWAHFLGIVADDLYSGKWFVDEETNELKLREFRETRVEPPYFSILRWRMDQKHGRKVANRKSRVPPNRTASPVGSGANSPYTSPTEPSNAEPRGRSMQRLSSSSPLASPRPAIGKPSPLARVTEETALPDLAESSLNPANLVELETPRPSEDEVKQTPSQTSLLPGSDSNEGKNGKETAPPPASGNKGAEAASEPMKEIEI
ncbi:glucan synthesis regulatory protein [Sodiomyces alkalinus F11]|uniref:Glucan synthesis regulatory protein n=1 Tax=Sodiomyces alkalinus (strain CBS 110278 / VKM F-3762 / F11) TaxID=1314773 RepID=A0A3N2PXK6_SODAK|nr:glucan synthesis regulatory protein [Sodiomyces alkalinus F11]ROT39156.1 glucan synthesis regulatory protein [Sodiomyces alkalinus F11]